MIFKLSDNEYCQAATVVLYSFTGRSHGVHSYECNLSNIQSGQMLSLILHLRKREVICSRLCNNAEQEPEIRKSILTFPKKKKDPVSRNFQPVISYIWITV